MNLTFERHAAGQQPRLLVVDANRNYLGVLSRRLAEFGYRVATAESAQAGLAEMYRIPADLVLCDVELRGTDGIEFARMVRDDPVHRDVPVLLIVARSDPGAARTAADSTNWSRRSARPSDCRTRSGCASCCHTITTTRNSPRWPHQRSALAPPI